MNNNYLNLYKRIMSRNHMGAGTMGTNRSSIQVMVESYSAMDELRGYVRFFTEHYDTCNAIFGLTENGPIELTTGLFVVSEAFDDQEQALAALRPGQALQLYGAEQSRIYRTGYMVESLEQTTPTDVIINVATLERMDDLTGSESILTEGGNVFDGTTPIAKENIEPTLKEFTKQIGTIFPKVARYWDNSITLGSVGKKAISGDIDLAISDEALTNPEDWGLDPQQISKDYTLMLKRARTSSAQDIMKHAIIKSIGGRINDMATDIVADIKGSGNGVLFMSFPQYNPDGSVVGRVQIDANFGDIDWLTFAYYSDSYAGNIKGLHRTQLMLHLFTAKGYVFSHNKGIKIKDTGEWVAKHPEEALALLNDLYHFNLDRKTVENYHKLQEYLRTHLSETNLNHVYDIYLQALDRTRCDIPEDLQPYWVENKERLGLTGKFLPPDSQLAPMK